MAEMQPAVTFGSRVVDGSIVLDGIRRREHEGWRAAMTTVFAAQVARETIGHRLGVSDERHFADAAYLAAEEPPLSPSSAGVLYNALHEELNARRAREEGEQA